MSNLRPKRFPIPAVHRTPGRRTKNSLGRGDLEADDGLAHLPLRSTQEVRDASTRGRGDEYDRGRAGALTTPRTEESKVTSQRRRSSAALRTTGREPERPRRAAIADMSMAAGESGGTGAVETGIGEEEEVWALLEGREG
jgi:hypothetical protein